MARDRGSALQMTGEQATQVLAYLVHEGKIAASAVRKAVERREQLVRELKSRLAQLGEELAPEKRPGRNRGRQRRSPDRAPSPVRKRTISAALRKVRQAQGRYMAALRPLSKDARKRIKAIREKSGVNVAIGAAKRMAR